MKKKILISISFFILLIVLILYLVIPKGRKSKGEVKNIKKAVRIEKKETPTIKTIKSKVKRGENITEIFMKNGVERKFAINLVINIKNVYNLAKIRAGNEYKLIFQNKLLKRFLYYFDINKYLDVNIGSGNFNAKIITIPFKTKNELIKVKIDSSLFEAILKEKEKPELADLLASLYDYDVDFNRDLRKGDLLIALIEKEYLNNRFVKYGNIIASSFINNGARIDIIRYKRKDGTFGYFHPDGRAVKKMFLKSPLPFMRVTSRFGWRRHPILGFSARHNGVDLGAPVGTRVRTTASGIVIAKGYDRVRGRYLIIRHANGYRTHYYHLSGYARGIRKGKKVSQGQIIAYSGNTGRSTGPHLHYGVQKYGRYINPLTLKSPSLKPLSKKEIPAFKEYSKKILRIFNEIIVFNLDKKEIKRDLPNKLKSLNINIL